MRVEEKSGIRVLHLDADGPLIGTSADASDLVGAAYSEAAELVALPVERLEPEFFRLRSLVAGEIVQKLVNYRLRLAVVGDFSGFVAASEAFRAFVWESNRGVQVWFCPDEAALDDKLAAAAARDYPG